MDEKTFISNRDSQWEVFRVEFVAIVMVLLRNLCLSVFFQQHAGKVSGFLTEFIALVLPMLFCLTIFSEHLNTLIAVGLLISVALAVVQISLDRRLYYLTRSTDYISYFRTAMFIGTATAILAVDFHVFPNRFAKSGNYGISVMDIGTAMFVFSMALSEHLLAHRPQKSKSNLIKASPVYIPSFAILLAIGFIRELFVHIFDYGHSTTEYGEHWNFFITLGFLKLFTTILPYPYSIPVGLLIGAAYQASLNLGLEAFIMRPDRDEYNIFDANREGICSLFGYIFAYCLTLIVIRIVALVDGIFTPSPKSVTLIMISGVIVYCLQVQSMWMFGQPSRRIANTPYTLAMLCMKVIILGLLQVVQLFGVPKNGENGKMLQKNSENVNGNGFQPSLLEAISRNCLWFFLIANLGTGLVNLSISTHRVYSTVVQMTILIVYCFAICLIIYLWHMYNNRKKPNTKSNSASLLNIAIGK